MADDAKRPKTDSWRPQTMMVRGGLTRSQHGETSEALFLSSGFVYDSPEQQSARMAGDEEGYIYSRYANPTVRMFEERLAQIEGAEDCRATASGMAAIHTMLVAPIKSGERIVAPRALFSSVVWILKNVMPKMGVDVTWVDGSDIGQWEKALKAPARFTIIETPSNPLLDAVDMRAVADLTHRAGGEFIVDNVFASPVLQKPLQFGADWVVYSTTKHMDGQGRTLGGAILGKKKAIEDELQQYYRHTGPSMSPFNAWVVLKGLETLELRMLAQSAAALELARWLESHPKVSRVHYPGLESHPQHQLAKRQQRGGGAVVSFEVEGGRVAAWRVIDSTRLMSLTANLGDVKTTIIHPASTTHGRISPEARAAAGITDGLIRVAVGLEAVSDLKEDLQRGLEAEQPSFS
jgi:O-succinylhomoserine sulfhydrylase